MARIVRWVVRFLVVLVVVGAAGSAAASAGGEPTDEGWAYGGVGGEAEARQYPCAPSAAGAWSTTGPVVCFPKRADAWWVDPDTDGYQCTGMSGTGWTGSCIFSIDMGDHVKVWGTRGIPYTHFFLRWGASGSAATAEAKPDADVTEPESHTAPESQPAAEPDTVAPSGRDESRMRNSSRPNVVAAVVAAGFGLFRAGRGHVG